MEMVECDGNKSGIEAANTGNVGVIYFWGQTHIFLSRANYERVTKEGFERMATEVFGRDYLLAWSGGEEVVSTPGYFEKEHVFQIVLPPLQFLQEAGKRAVRDPDKKMEGLVKKIKEVTKQ